MSERDRDTGYKGVDSTSVIPHEAIRNILPHPDRVTIVARRRSAQSGVNNMAARGPLN